MAIDEMVYELRTGAGLSLRRLAELSDVGEKIIVGPRELCTTYVLDDGTEIKFRPVHPTDEPPMRQLFYELSQQTVYYRFMTNVKAIPRKQLHEFTYIDHRNEVAIVATLPESHGEDFIAVGRYYLNPRTNRAEVAFVVVDQWQNNGIGSFLLNHLIAIARRNGIRGFTAEVLLENRAMQRVFNKSNTVVHSEMNEDVVSYSMDFE